MAQTRKRNTRSSAKTAATKKQKTAKGAKSVQPKIAIDEGFEESSKLPN